MSVIEGQAMAVFDSPLVVPDKLHIYPWKIFPDMVELDWYIRLRDKDRLVCHHHHYHYHHHYNPDHHQDGWL